MCSTWTFAPLDVSLIDDDDGSFPDDADDDDGSFPDDADDDDVTFPDDVVGTFLWLCFPFLLCCFRLSFMFVL